MEITIIVAMVTGVTEALKKAFDIKKRFLPLISIALGLLIVVALNGEDDLISAIMGGIVVGLSSSGLYDVAKKTILNK